MGRHWNGRTREAERVAGQAFHELVAAVEAGGHGARSLARRGVDLVDRAAGAAEERGGTVRQRLNWEGASDRLGAVGDRLGDAVDESRRRAGAALDALAGRKPPVQWEWILAGAVAGALAGWLVAQLSRRAAEEALVFEDTESVVADENRGAP